MDRPSPWVRNLARRLLGESRTDSDPAGHEAVRVCETLRNALIQFAGADGFTSLLRRSLALSSAEVPALDRIKVTADGRLEGFETLAASGERNEAAVVIIANLLGLLTTFIGKTLTLRLVREAWPGVSLDDEH